MNGRAQRTLVAWLERRADHWRRLAELARRRRDRRGEDVDEVMELVERFRSLGRDLSLARALAPDARLTRELEALFLECHEVVYRPPSSLRAALLELFRDRVPEVTARLAPAIAVTTALFLGAALAGWMLITLEPEMVSLIGSERMIERVQRGELWTDDLLNVVPSSVLSISIMTNNIAVALTAFALGALYGLGTMYVMVLNGFMLGGVFAFTARHDLAGRLFEFVVAHAVVEISVIVLAGAAGIRLGEALVRPGVRPRADAFRDAVREAGQLLPVVALFLVGAGVIEGYVSPDPAWSFEARVAVGVGYGALLWLVLSGRVWPRRRAGRASPPGPAG